MERAAFLLPGCWMVIAVMVSAAWGQGAPTQAVASTTADGSTKTTAGAGSTVGVGAGPAVVPVTPVTASGTASSAGAPGATTTPTGGVGGARSPTIRTWFSMEKPVLGMPLGGNTRRAYCSTDGTAFYDLASTGTGAGQQLYGISADGSVKHLLRKLPIDYTNVVVRDFFAGSGQLVTLLEADEREDGADASPRETDYFLSLEDVAGDFSDLVRMAVRFKPVKVARFATGDVMVLGWDEGNLLPVLAIVKEDGSIRRFVDLDAIRAGAANGDLMRSAEEIVKRELASLESLRGATFVADGDEVLLTWPGSTRPIVALGAFGEARVIPIMIPNGYVLNDVLGSSGGRWPLVVRVKDADQRPAPAAEDAAKPVKMLLLEYDSTHGTLIRRIAFDKPQVSEVTCAPNSSLTAVFYDTIPDASNGSAATQLVVATGRR